LINFPVLCFAGDNTADFVEDYENLSVCSVEAFGKGYYDGMQLVDCCGYLYIVRHAEKVGSLPFYWGWSFLTMPRMLRVKLYFDREISRLTINEFKEKIYLLIRKHSLFEPMAEGKEIEEKIKFAGTFKEVMEFLK